MLQAVYKIPLCVLLLASVALRPGGCNGRELTLAVFVSGRVSGVSEAQDGYTGDLDGRPFRAAVNMAVEMVNNDSAILPGYTLARLIKDSRCEAGTSVRAFIDQIFQDQIMIVGSDCSVSSEPIAELAPFWNLVQFSPLSTSPRLSARDTFGTFLRLVPSDVAVVAGIVDLMERFDWTRIAVIQQQEFIFTTIFSALQDLMNQRNITTDPREFTFNTGDSPQENVQRLVNSPTRFIFLNTYPAYALEILCQAVRSGLTHRNGYQWILFHWYPDQWWLNPPANRTYQPAVCSQSEIVSILDFAITVDHYPCVDPDTPTNVGMTRTQFQEALMARLEPEPNVDLEVVNQAHFYFDATWAAALALEGTRVELNDSVFVLEDFSTLRAASDASVTIGKALHANSLNVSFLGLSGPISFSASGERMPTTTFFQYRRDQDGSGLMFAQIGNESGFVSESEIFPLGRPVDERFVFISLPLFVIYTLLALAGIVCAFLALSVNLIFWNKKPVKLSGPILNLVIIAGIIVFFIEVILFGVDENVASRSTTDALCMTRLWLAALAFTLVMGTILVKSLRVFYIFHSTRMQLKKSEKSIENEIEKIIPDPVLLIFVGVLLLLDVVYLAFAQGFAPMKLTNIEIASTDSSLPEIIAVCQAEDAIRGDIWLIILLAYKGLLLLIGLFFAFETRKVKLRHINDTKLLGLSVVVFIVLGIALTAVGFLLEEFVDVYYGLIGIMILMGNFAVLCILFIPKLYGLWKSRGEDDVMSSDPVESSSRETVTQLNQEIEKLQNELQQLNGHAGGDLTVRGQTTL